MNRKLILQLTVEYLEPTGELVKVSSEPIPQIDDAGRAALLQALMAYGQLVTSELAGEEVE